MIELIAFIAGVAMLLFIGYAVFDVSNTLPKHSTFK